MMTYHVRFLLLVLAGWVNRQQQDVVDYLREENRVLRAGLRGKRLRLSDDDRRRLAVKAQALGREALAQIASVATPATLLRWYRCLIAAKYDGTKNRSPGRPPTAKDIRELIVRMGAGEPDVGIYAPAGRTQEPRRSGRWVARHDGTPFRIEDVANQLSDWRGAIEEFQSAIRARAQNIET